MPPIKILIIEDNAEVLKFLYHFLQAQGYELCTSPSAELVEMLCGKFHPAILLTDVTLPGVSGTTLARKMMAEDPQLKVLLITGYPTNRDVDSENLRHMRPDAYRFMQKPFKPEELLHALKQLMGTDTASA